MKALVNLPLYLRLCLINGAVLVCGAVVLAFSPATVSAQVLVSEVVVLACGLAVVLTTTSLLLRSNLAPLDRLIKVMERVDLEQPGQRLPEAGVGTVRQLGHTFNAMLSRLEVERSTSNARALAAQEAERHRIAQELHDEIGQGLTVVLLGLRHALERAPEDIAEELRLVRDAARSSLEEVQHVARRLRPGVLEDLGLLSSLAALATDFSAHSDAHVRRRLAPDLLPLTSEAELVIYRVAQEALTNAARHSAADKVDLSLTTRDHGVVLRISDNGLGIRGHPEGAGVRGMRERALLIGATLSIDSPAGGGTSVRLYVPSSAESVTAR